MDRSYVKYTDQDGRFRSLNIDSIPYNPKECLDFEKGISTNFKNAKCINKE